MTFFTETESRRASFLWHVRFFGKSTTGFSQFAVSLRRPAGGKTGWQFIFPVSMLPSQYFKCVVLVKSYTELSLYSWNMQFLCCMRFSHIKKVSIIKKLFPLWTVIKCYIMLIWAVISQPVIIETITHHVVSFTHNHSWS